MTRPQPIARYVALLCIGTVVPTILCSALLLQQLVADQRAQTASRAQSSADRLAALFDSELSNLKSVAQALSTSPLLQQNALPAFKLQALRAVQGQTYDLVLQRADGRPIIATRSVSGQPTASTEHAPWIDSVVASGRAAVSNAYRVGSSKHSLVSVSVPVETERGVQYVLSATTTPSKLLSAITPRNDNRTWRVELVDGVGRIAAAIGPDGLRGGPEAAARSRVSRWSLRLHGPRNGAFSRATGKTRDRIIIFGVLTTLCGLLAATLLGRAISRSLRRVGDSAHGLASHGSAAPTESNILEVRELEDALGRVSQLLREQAEQRDEHAADLAHLNATLEARVAEETRELAAANLRLESEAKERAVVEARLRQMQKLEAVGLLTGGIAHDFNNMLSIIIGSIELAQRKSAEGQDTLDRLLNDALAGAQSAAALTRQLLAFGRQQSLSPEEIDLNEVILSMRDMLQRTLGEKIVIDLRLSDDLWPSFLDRSQIESSLLNLAINARDAMASGGTLTVETANVTVDEEPSLAHERAIVGEYAVVTVTDSGSGIPQDILSRVVDPFFTTKEVGKGSGLGLSQVHGFLGQSNGHLRIYSEQNIGTTIRLYVPRCQRARSKEAKHTARLDTSDKRRTVFVVEDNDLVREASVQGMRELGYEVLHASSAEEALQNLSLASARVDLLFTDVVMPGMNGSELAEVVSRTHPELKIAYATGYSRNVALNGLIDKESLVIEKPFTLNQLSSFLDRAFNEVT